jgi:hypothetical protein
MLGLSRRAVGYPTTQAAARPLWPRSSLRQGDDVRLRIGALPLVWIIIGVIVAWSNDYFQDVNTANQFWSAVLAVIAWPLPLFGADIVVR